MVFLHGAGKNSKYYKQLNKDGQFPLDPAATTILLQSSFHFKSQHTGKEATPWFEIKNGHDIDAPDHEDHVESESSADGIA